MKRKKWVYVVAPAGGFVLLIALALGGLYLYYRNGSFYDALKGQFLRGFYLSAAALLVCSSIVYTPFSYGISHYFLVSESRQGAWREIFYLFRRPLLLSKATALAVVKKVLIWLERIWILLLGALAEAGLFFLFLTLRGENIFMVEGNLFRRAAEFMLQSPWLIGLSAFLWCVVLVGLIRIRLRYLLCKYVLLCYPDAGIGQAIRVGRASMRWGRILRFLTAGCGFSVYASAMVRDGWREYCRKRSLR